MRGVAIALMMACACSIASACGRAEAVPGVASVTVAIPARVEAGGPVLLSYSFTPAAILQADFLWVFVHALDDDNELRLTDDHAPPTPTQNWRPGEPVTYRRTLFMPPGVEPGTIRFEVGLFSRASGERLPLTGTDRGMRSYEVGTVSVTALTNPVVAGDGWHDAEAGEGPGRQWNWSRKEGRLSFRNPKAPVTVYLEINQPVTALPASQAVDVHGPGGSLATVALTPGSTQLLRIPLSPEQLGTGDTVELTVAVGQTFVPAATPALSSGDTRELGIRLLNAFVGPSEAPPR